MGETVVLVGLHWGDEGKGKVIDVLTDTFKMVIRFQGGANAGHTVQAGGEEYIFHVVPSGILHKDARCIIGNGVVADPAGLVEEIKALRGRGVRVEPDNLLISDRAHVVMSVHKLLDRVKEQSRGSAKIGTTGRGIGPCYADKAARCGIRFAELVDPQMFRPRLENLLAMHNPVLEKVYETEPLDVDEVFEEYSAYADYLRPYVTDALPLIHRALAEGENILLEGAQGSLLDINFGTYPYVTSSEICGGVSPGSGIPPMRVDRALGLVKSYCSRVGEGPFPTEQDNPIGDRIRELGHEYGSTTGRPRRCGWLDCVALRHTVALNGVTSIALGLLDVLSEFETLKICTGYRLDGRRIEAFPANLRILDDVEPVYEELRGWQCDITGARRWADLPPNAHAYIRAVEQACGARVDIVGVGPDRSQTILRGADE
jgi:adenylosuccinate synthase